MMRSGRLGMRGREVSGSDKNMYEKVGYSLLRKVVELNLTLKEKGDIIRQPMRCLVYYTIETLREVFIMDPF